MGCRVRSNAKIAPGLRGHISKAGAPFSGARRGPYVPVWMRRELALAASGDAAVTSPLDVPVHPEAPSDDRGSSAIDLPSLLLGLLFLVVLVAVSTVRL